jgi:hypothetical protein
MLSLSDQQLRQVQQAAGMLPVHARDNFLRSVANRLSDNPGDHEVSAAISLVLGLRGVAIGHCHPKENRHAPIR